MPTILSDPRAGSLKILRGVVAVVLGVSVAVAVVGTVHWPVVGDAPLMHYIAFLMDHGKVPYRDIVDINMPGTYALEWGAIHFLGAGAMGWRIFDFLLIGVCGAAMVAIAWPVDWLAGFFAGALFALIHFRDGPTHTGQRDLMMTTMLLVACATLFYAVRSERRWGALVFGLFAGAASIIKPSGALFAAALIVLLCLQLRALRRAWVSYLALATAGFMIPMLACVVWLMSHGVLRAFLEANRGIVAYHASLGRPSLAALIVGSFPSVLLAVAIPALPLLIVTKAWTRWEGLALMVCAVLGAVSYVIQGKGFPYHRYPTEAFLLLGCGLLLVPMMQGTTWVRVAAVIGVIAGGLYLGPVSAAIACRYDWRNQEFNQSLASDLTRLGGDALQDKVQCIDMTSGCLNTLYNMQLVQTTGYLYDCYMFQPTQTAVSLKYREDFWEAIAVRPPAVFVVTDQECFSMARSFALPQRWPQFQSLLDEKYTLVEQRTPPHLVGWWRKPAVPYSYRIYVQKAH